MIKSFIQTTRQEVVARHGVVSAGHELEAEAGVQMMEMGGNAVDAAVAAAFVAGVIEPWNTGIGGHGFASIYKADTQETEILNWVTKAPRRATPTMYDLVEGTGGVFGWPLAKGDAQNTGYLAAEMPGGAGALAALLKMHGTMTLSQVIQPAIRLAMEGWPVDWRSSFYIANVLEDMRHFPALGAIYAPTGLPPRAGNFFTPGDRLVLGDLGCTLTRMAQEGTEFIYKGDVAQKIDAEMAAHGGIITAQDLAELEPVVEQEQRWSYRGITYITGVCPIIVEVLNILECFDLPSMEPNSPLYRHLMLEAMRQAWVDCLTHLGDPNFVDAPWQGLQSKAYAQEMASTIDPKKAAQERRAGDPWKYEGRSRPASSAGTETMSTDLGPRLTTQVVSIDKHGNMVSLEHSLGNSFGSKVAIPGTGIVLGNGMCSFDPRPGRPQSIVPGKRPIKIAPAILMFVNDQPYVTICASGGRRTTSAALHIMVHLVDFGMKLQEAIEAHRVHSEVVDCFIDNRLPEAAISDLTKMGHHVVPVLEDVALGNFGRPSAALIDPVTRMRHAGGDHLRSSGAAGY